MADGPLNLLVHCLQGKVLQKMTLRRRKKRRRLSQLMILQKMIFMRRSKHISVCMQKHLVCILLFLLTHLIILHLQNYYRGRSPVRERDRDRRRDSHRHRSDLLSSVFVFSSPSLISHFLWMQCNCDALSEFVNVSSCGGWH